MNMKKIFALLLIVFFSMQFCLAEENGQAMEDIDSYFNDDTQPAIEQPITPTNVANPEQSINQVDQNEYDPNYDPNGVDDIHLNGYLEYTKPTEEQDYAIHLEPVETKTVNFSSPKSFKADALTDELKKPTFQPMRENLEAASKFSSLEYDIKPFSTTFGKKYGKFSFGTMYDSFLDSTQVSYSTGLFTKYEGKHFAISTAFSKSTSISNMDSYNDKVYFIPELKLTKRLSLLDIMQTDVQQINKKNEIVLRYTPHFKKYADDVQFELGAGQSFYDDSYVKSSVRFSTRFKL